MQGVAQATESREWVVIESGGLRLFGVLHRPIPLGIDRGGTPIVLVLHGFASSKHGSNRCYVSLAEFLAREQIATLRFDFRGSGDSEGSLSQATLEDLVSDALAISRALGSLEGIDAARLGLFGASLGGTIAIQACALGCQAKALALWAPVASGDLWFQDFLMHHPELISVNQKEILSTYRGVRLHPLFREQFAKLRAHHMLAQIPDLPLLHMQGTEDDTISLAHQEAFRKSAGRRARFVTYPQEQHSLGYACALPKILKEISSFFKETL